MSEKRPDDMENDARLTALYRAAGEAEPPPALDDAIRAAARRAVASRPVAASSPFSHSWRLPISVAAVVVVSASLVMMIREQAPELVRAPSADSRPQAATQNKPAEFASKPEIAGTPAPDPQKPSSLGLKPSSSSGVGLRRETEPAAPITQLRKQEAAVDRMEKPAPFAPPSGKLASPEPFPGVAAMRDNKVTAPAEQPRALAKEETRRDVAGAAETQRQSMAAESNQAPSRLEADNQVRERARPQAKAAAVPAPVTGDALEAKKAVGALRESARVPESAPPSVEERQRAPAPAAKPAPPPAPKPEAKPAANLQGYVNLPPEKWLAHIEELRKQGRVEEARISLAEFKKRHPDFPLPPALKDGIQP